MRALGRDWSSFQRPVTKDTLAGLAFGFVRVSDWAAFPSLGTDRNFPWDWKQLGAFGLVRGAYWYLRLDAGAPSPQAQAAQFVGQVRNAGLHSTDILVCDSEEDHPDVDAGTLAFQREVLKLSGQRAELVVTYTDLSVGSKLASTSQEFPSLWIAWPSQSPPVPAQWAPAKWPDWAFWQNGITRQSDGEQVDADQFNGTAAQLKAFVTGPAAVTAEEDEDMIMIEPAQNQVPAGAKWPGIFLLFGNGSLHHITQHADGVSNVDAYKAAGVKGPVEITWAEWESLQPAG